MRALLLAAGIGTRLRPFTNTIPKCLVTIKGQPLLGIWLDRLSKAGIGPILINTHYLAKQVADYIESMPNRGEVSLVYEKDLRGTAGTLISNLKFFQDMDGLLIHADNYCLADFAAFQQAHANRPPECLITMMTFQTNDPSSCGIVELDDRRVVVGFHEKVSNPPGNLANGAIYILSKEFFEILAEKFSDVTDFSRDVLPQIVGRIYSYETKDTFIDIGTPSAYQRCQE